jgi:26S proteasome regulatory subunit (ATPase 3-interacting protein)
MILQQNRPLNSQNVADALQKFSLKKTGVQKALDALADSGQISFKEYGKQKIYLARQDQFDIPNGEELEEMKKANSKLQEEIADQKKITSEVESGKFCLVATPMLYVVLFMQYTIVSI